MRLEGLIRGLPVELTAGSSSIEVTAVVEDSRAIRRGDLFVARRGTADDGRRYIDDAIGRGAVAILTDRGTEVASPHAVVVRADDVARSAAIMAERLAGDPSTRLALVGITGTNGKTTVASLVHQMLGAADVAAGLIGTVRIALGDDAPDEPADLTTPSAAETSRLLARMVDHGCRACVMEASSHALDQGRTAGLRFTGAVFTNLSGDHLDYHGSMDAYLDAKGRLFDAIDAAGWAVVNVDDPAAEPLLARCAGEVVATSLERADADCRASILEADMAGTRCRLDGPWGAIECHLPMPGRHNVANALQAVAVAHRLGLDDDALRRGLAVCAAPPGRLEPVSTSADDVTVLVDYAHTDDALDNVLGALRPVVPGAARLRVVFGCGGDRDRAKRPRMAAAACRWADDIIVTSDNPRTEDPAAIVDEILTGVPPERRARTARVVDRSEAIRFAIASAGVGDVIVIAGKGHETYQIVGRAKRDFDDRVEARRALAVRSAGDRAGGRAGGASGIGA